MMLRIRAPSFVAGLVLSTPGEHEIVTEAAPILKYMRGWSKERVEQYCQQRRWTLEAIEETDG